MSRETKQINGFLSPSRAIALCLGSGFLLFAFASPVNRALNAEAERQNVPTGRIRLGLPVPIPGGVEEPRQPVKSAKPAELQPQNLWQTDKQTLQLIDVSEQAGPKESVSVIDFQPLGSRPSRKRSPFRSVAQQKQLEESDKPATGERPGAQDREEWSVPGAYERSRDAQNQSRSTGAVDAQSEVGIPQPFGEGVASEEESTPKEIDPVIAEPAPPTPDEPTVPEVVDAPPLPQLGPVNVVPQLQVPQPPVAEPIIQPRSAPSPPSQQATSPLPDT